MTRLLPLLVCLVCSGCYTTYVPNKGTPRDEMAANIERAQVAKQDRLRAAAAEAEKAEKAAAKPDAEKK